MMFLLPILGTLFPTIAGGQFGDDIYPCNVHTDYTPTVWAPTGTYTPPTVTSTWVSPGSEDGSLVLRGGQGPHQGNVIVRDSDGSDGPIRSCDENRENGGNYGWCKY